MIIIKAFSNRKRERDVGVVGRPFKMKARERKILLDVAGLLFQTVLPLHYQDFYLTLIRAMFAEILYLYSNQLIKLCVPLPKKLYKRSRRLRTIEEVEEYFPGFKAFIDATEQEIPRPENKRRKRKRYYSDKKRSIL